MADFLPQLIEFATQLDLQRLIVAQTTICLFAAIRSVPVYNLPLLFFGLYAYQHHDSAEPLQQFAGFTAFTILLDIVWCLLSPGIGFGEGLTIAVLLFKPITIISALQLLKYRGDPFSSLGGGTGWSSRGNGGFSGYQSLGDAMDDERDAEEISIPRHHSGNSHNSSQLHYQHQHHPNQHGRNRLSQQSSSFMTTSSRSASVKSSRTGSGHNVEPATNTTSNSSYSNSNAAVAAAAAAATGHHSHGGNVATNVAAVGKDDRRDKVGQNISEDEDEDTSSRETAANVGP